MAESAITTRRPSPLTGLGFRIISNGVSHYTPTNPPSQTDPSLILFCSWAFAQPRHIAKYITQYQTLYPSSHILLVQNVVANAIWRPDAWQHTFFAPAAQIMRQHATRNVLVHLFSNGGSHAAVQLSEVYTILYGENMHVSALLMDSCPGQPRFQPTVEALKAPVKNPIGRVAVSALSWMMVGTTALFDILEICEPAAFKLYRKLNDMEDAFLLNGGMVVPRAYLFSETDVMILPEDVRGHAEVARKYLRKAGHDELDEVVRLEEFKSTDHVNHVKNEPERYWQIVQDTWRRGSERSSVLSEVQR